MTRASRMLTAWIACFSILLAALAPSISTVLAAVNGVQASWTEICSVAPPGVVRDADASATLALFARSVTPAKPVPTDSFLHHDHCPFCFTHAASFGLPPTTMFTFPVIVSFALVPTLFYHAPRPLFMWTAAQSRAPPQLS